MTNLEWIKTLSAEELADWFYDEWLPRLQYRWSSSRGGLIIWLKDRKTESNSEKPNNYCDDCLYTDTCDSKEFFYACTSKATISKMEQVDEPQTEPNLILPERMERGEMYEVGDSIVVMNSEDYYDLLCKSWEKTEPQTEREGE